MSDEDETESIFESDSDRLDAEIKSLSFLFAIIGAGFFATLCVIIYAISVLLSKG